MKRVLVVGTTGSGKTTVASRLARDLAVPFVDLDALFWKPNWTESEAEEFSGRVAEATQSDRWVADGDYLPRIGDLLWDRADTVVWLDSPVWVVVGRLVRRTVSRSLRRTELWAGNREGLSNLWNKGQSLMGWARQIRAECRAEYSSRMTDPHWAHLRFVRLRSASEVRRWLASVSGATER